MLWSKFRKCILSEGQLSNNKAKTGEVAPLKGVSITNILLNI